MKQSTGKREIDFSDLKQIVIDEADTFFSSDRDYDQLKTLHKTLNGDKENSYY